MINADVVKAIMKNN